MAQLKIFKVNALPATLEPSALYFIKRPNDRFSIYLTDMAGSVIHLSPDSTDVSAVTMAIINNLLNQPGGIAGLDLNGNVLGNIIATAIDGQDTDVRSDGDYVWRDLKDVFILKNTSGGNNPTFGTLWDTFQGLLFSATTMNQVWSDFHLDHDLAEGTKIYPHIHWMPTTNDTGVVRWGIAYSVAKGHNQQSFPTETTVYVETSINVASQWRHIVSEVSDTDAILTVNAEPDSVIKARFFRDGSHVNDTYPGLVHAWQADLHYQVARIGTRNRAPNFYTP